MSVVDVISQVAAELGVDPRLALADAQVESGLDPQAIGDGGTSFGLFQLHQGGELTAAGLSPQQAFDPALNSRVALSYFVPCEHQFTDPGQIAACAERPADPVGYAAKVDQAYQALGGGLPNPLQVGAAGVGAAILAVPAAIGHGLAGALGSGVHDATVFVQRQIIALAVAAVVLLVLFIR